MMVAAAMPGVKVESEGSPSEGGAEAEKSSEKGSESLITWVALGLVVGVFFGVLGYVYIRGRKGSAAKRAAGGKRKGSAGDKDVDDGQEGTKLKEIERSLLDGDHHSPPFSYNGDLKSGPYVSVPLGEGEEAHADDEEERSTVEEETKLTIDPISAAPTSPAAEEETQRVRVVTSMTEAPKPMVPVFLTGGGKGVAASSGGPAGTHRNGIPVASQ